MEFDFVYASLQVTLALRAKDDSLFGSLSPSELLIVQQLLFLSLSNFSTIRSLYKYDEADRKKLADAKAKSVDS